MPYRSAKTYGHDIGLSACFRQWRADSHCRFLHGYALAVHLEFEASDLDERNWVVDFGSLKPVKVWLQEVFDHATLVAHDDPELEWFMRAHERGVLQLGIVDGTGCEMFAKMIFAHVKSWLRETDLAPRVSLAKVEVREHGANSAQVCA